MDDKNRIYTSLSFEYFMSSLFGSSNYLGYVGSHRKSWWKKDLIKITNYIKKTIRINVESDNYHRNKLFRICDNLITEIKSAKSIDQINVCVIQHLIKLIFNLMGYFPNHWNRKRPYKDKYWYLGGHRKIIFVQSDEQKVSMILNLVDIEKEVKLRYEDGYEDLHDLFLRKFKSNRSDFLKWFKEKYPKKYCELF